MSDNDKVTIWGGVPRFGANPAIGQAIVGSGNGFVIYESAEDNTSAVVIPNVTPLPNKNMELAQKTVAGVTTQYYGFAGYCGSYFSTISQSNVGAPNFVSINISSLQYGISVSGTPITQFAVINPGVYRITGTLDFFCNEAKVPVNPVTQWSDIALEVYIGVWIRKNGVEVDWTRRPYKMIGDYSRLVVNLDYMIDLAKDDYIEIAWESASANTSLYSAAGGYPSILLNISLVR